MTANDMDLLRDFARGQSQDAFTALVQRHLDLVYCAALRQVRSLQLAEEIAQSVFTDLARNAGRLKPGTVLNAWLYQVTRRTAIDVVRRESRRQLREQIAFEMNAMNATDASHRNPTEANWTQIEPLLDEAMHALEDNDRTAVLLRYFENKSLREVGETLGTSDDAARKRVGRAVDRLREFFTKQGVTVGLSGLTVIISANAVQAAPVGLSSAVATTAVTSTLANATDTLMAWSKTKIAILVLGAVLFGGTTTYVLTRNSPGRGNLAEEVRGIGLALASDRKTGAPIIMIVVPGSAPARAGLTKGLVIHAIDGVPTAGVGLRECMRRIDSHRVVQLELIDPLRNVTNTIQYIHGDPSENMGGIGIALGRDTNAPATIMAIVPDSAAARAGLSKGLAIHAIDDVLTAGMNPRECLNRIQGLPGSIVRLKLINPKRHVTNTVELTRCRL